MKQIMILIALFAIMQNVMALNILPVSENQEGNRVISYPILRCGFIDRPENVENEGDFINKGAVRKPQNPRWRNPFSTESSFKCQIVWVEKEMPASER